MCSSRKYPYNPHRKDWNFLVVGGWGGSVRPKHVKNVLCLIGISRGVGGLRNNPFHGGGMDIFWNYTM